MTSSLRIRARALLAGGAATAVFAAAACTGDPSPDMVRIQIAGPAEPVSLELSANFAFSVNELGQTNVRVFGLDTVRMTLPIDTVVDISLVRQILVQLRTLERDTLELSRVRIDVDGDVKLDGSVAITRDLPLRFVFAFNRRVTPDINLLF